ncbi:putative repeat protein (TIGR03943 family) [Paenibacillus castaneae]|uniref:TIGR03943 family putative permease subunit n=1 Tax=Paenibacillus castaneae TaxID=474957 RepID=UPI000C9CFAD2|nr:TIGR03943 family protein [Paenibacillus castaneae]NIK78271.1 putative repeat protein (TIGR03943 family) [Paenibacillus castaneae]
MGNNRVSIVHHLLKLVILLGFTGYLVYLALTGEILLFIAPHLVKYVEIAAAGLFLFCIFQLYFSIRSLKQPDAAHDCDHGHCHHHDLEHGHSHEPSRSLWKNVMIYGLFILPLLFGLFLPNQAFAGSLARNKGMNVGGEAVTSDGVPLDLAQLVGNEDAAIKQLFRSDKYNRDYAKLGMLLYQQDLIEMKDEWFIEKLQALHSFADQFEGKQIKIKGFIYRENELSENQFIIGRMAMTHCIADISPYGIVTESPDASSYANDTWVTITGTIEKTTYHNQTVIKIIVENVEPATAPVIPYVYPDWGFAQKLQ